MFCLLLSLICSITYDYPSYSMMFAGLSSCQKNADEIMGSLDEIKKICKKSKEGDEIYIYCQIIGPLEGYYCTSPSTIQDDISKISKNTKLFFIGYSSSSSLTLDFNRLPTSTDVALLYESSYYKQTSKKFKSQIDFENIANAIHKLTNISVPFSLNNEKFRNLKESSKLSLVGDIKGKVNTLSIVSNYVTLEITNNDLNIDNLNLVGIRISKDESSKKIICKRLVVDDTTHTNIASNYNDIKEKIKVDLYGISLDYSNPLQVVIENDKWKLNKKGEDGKWTDYDTYSEVPYANAKSVCILSNSNEYDINVPSADVTKGQSVNITAFEFDIKLPSLSSKLLEEKKTLKVTKSGVWTGIPKGQVSVVVNYNKDEYTADIDKEFEEVGVKVEEQEPFEYDPTTSKGKNLGLIIGVTVACVVVVVVVIVVVVIIIKKKKKSQDKSVSEGEGNVDNA